MTTTPERRVRQPGPAPEHGTPQCYRRGCPRRECVRAATAAAKKWKYLRDTGRSGFVPAEKVIAHIWRLRTGMTDIEIREQANLARPHLYQILRNKRPILHTTAARILAIPVPQPTGKPTRNGSHIPRLGTRRRLQTLIAEGWPAKELDRRIQAGIGYTAYLLRGEGNDTVRLFTADAVRAVYDELVQENPEDHGVTAANAHTSRARATKAGWPGKAYWDADDFDNPHFTPAISDDLKRDQLAEVRRHEIQHLDSLGLSEHEIGGRLGMAESSVRNIVLELHTGQRRDRSHKAEVAA